MRALALVLLGGCSFVFVHGPPDPPKPPFECTDSNVAPYADLGIAGAFAAIGIFGVTAHGHTCDATEPDCIPNNLGVDWAHDFGAASLGVAVLYVLSSWYGFNETDACQKAPTTSPVARAPS